MKIKYAFERVLYDRKQYKNLVPVLLLSDFEEKSIAFFKSVEDCPLLSDDDIEAVKTYFKQHFKVEK